MPKQIQKDFSKYSHNARAFLFIIYSMEFVEVAPTRKGAVAMRQPLFLCLIQEKSHVHRQGKDILGIADIVISYFSREFSEKLPIFQWNFVDVCI